MGSTSYKNGGYKVKSGSSVGSDKEMNGKLRRSKIRRPSKMEFGTKRIPDYTEMAYKEAVGKLRYFLSGNYSPSVRSYVGSASIKNLDEPDLDKKYPGYLPDYRPRPKLTTKYTTLYADSLSNYNPANVGSAPPAPPAPAPALASTSPEVVHFIQKQEEYIEQLERESQYCRDELNTLLGKVKEVISENSQLHSAKHGELLSRVLQGAGSETDELRDEGSTGADSDHQHSPSKPRRRARSRTPKMEGSSIMFESRIAELEAQLTQARIDLKKSQEENNDNKRKLASGIVDSTCLDGFKRQIDNLQRDKNSLESQIAKMKLSLERREDPDCYKRGSDAVEQQLREERSNLEAEVRRLKEDLAKERVRVRELCSESARRAVHERSAAEQRYTAHFDDLSHDLAAQYDNVAKLQLELERQRRDDNDLKREISMKTAVIEELKMELKNKTSSLQADLAQAHAEKASLDEELASARLAIERHQRQAKHETNRLNSEIQSLRQRLDRADADLVHARRENLRLTEQIANLETELKMKDLTPTSPVRNKKEKEIEHAKTVAELETMIQSQNSLMEKLTGECRLLTDKLDDANRRHKEELASLHRQVDSLGRTIQHANAPNTYYEAPSTHAAAAHGNVEPAPPPGPDHTRGHPPAHPALRRQPSNSSVGDRHSNSQSRQLSRQPSKSSIRMENQPEAMPPVNSQNEQEYVKDSPVKEQYYVDETPVKETYENAKVAENISEVEQQNYEQPQPEYAQEPTYSEEPSHFEQQQGEYNQEQTYQDPTYAQEPANYDQSYAQETPTYQTEGYDQNYEQPAYTEGQYPENYEQQYADPNAQYEGQYENYATDPNQAYQGDPNYGNQAYDASNPEYSQVQDAQNTEFAQQNQNIPAETKDYVESKVTTSPIAKVPTQS
ncbi:serologically defined colon cancer antigen 8 homolog [Plutella xylostella]|uniref:serologically defined colon cancer antigen 8 homolog n=1 Tax=Plutella xylostella TaxID=51655 RepID=UPI002032B5F6|nr:serologically defined colon cancer antigen 8 homolog [Plutella xylostella]